MTLWWYSLCFSGEVAGSFDPGEVAPCISQAALGELSDWDTISKLHGRYTQVQHSLSDQGIS